MTDEESIIHILLDRIVDQDAQTRRAVAQRQDALKQAAKLREESAAKDAHIAGLQQERDEEMMRVDELHQKLDQLNADTCNQLESKANASLRQERDQLREKLEQLRQKLEDAAGRLGRLGNMATAAARPAYYTAERMVREIAFPKEEDTNE